MNGVIAISEVLRNYMLLKNVVKRIVCVLAFMAAKNNLLVGAMSSMESGGGMPSMQVGGWVDAEWW